VIGTPVIGCPLLLFFSSPTEGKEEKKGKRRGGRKKDGLVDIGSTGAVNASVTADRR